MPKKKIIVTRRWPDSVEKELLEHYDVTLNTTDEPFNQHKMGQALCNADAVLTTVTDKLDADVFNNNQLSASIIGNFGVGFSHIDIEAARARNIVITNTPDVLSECTADIAMTLMLMVSRRAAEGEREVRSGNWTGWRPTHMMGSRLSGKKLGIIGFGRIGRETAKRAHAGFGMPVIVHSRSPVDPTLLASVRAEQVSSIEELLQQADVISLHCPGGDTNRHLINRERLALMKPSSTIINTARGEVIDEAALVDALQQNRIAGAGLDVFENEPALQAGLTELDNVVILPHLGSATRETREEMGFRVISNIDAFFNDRIPADRVA